MALGYAGTVISMIFTDNKRTTLRIGKAAYPFQMFIMPYLFPFQLLVFHDVYVCEFGSH